MLMYMLISAVLFKIYENFEDDGIRCSDRVLGLDVFVNNSHWRRKKEEESPCNFLL